MYGSRLASLQEGEGIIAQLHGAPVDKRVDIAMRRVNTIVLGFAFLTMGMNLTIAGPTLDTLAVNMNESIAALSPSFFLRGAGYLVGSGICGALEGKIDIYYLLFGSLLVTAIGEVFVPVFLNKTVMFCFVFLVSIGLGGLETIGNVFCIQLWGKNVEPYLQFIQFCSCLGCVILPCLAQPFLNEVSDNYLTLNNTQRSTNVEFIEGSQIPYVSVVYFIVAALTTLIALTFFIVKFSSNVRLVLSTQTNTIKNEGKRFRYGMLGLISFFFFIYSGLEFVFLLLLFEFATSNTPGMNYSKDNASYLITGFFAAVTLGQFIAIFLSKKFSPKVLLLLDLVAMLISVVMMRCLPLYAATAHRLFWFALSLAGLAGAGVYGSVFLWAERYITVNGKAASIFIIGASLGEMILPIPVGQLIEQAPLSFLDFEVGYATAQLLVFFVMMKVASTKGKRLTRENSSGEVVNDEARTLAD